MNNFESTFTKCKIMIRSQSNFWQDFGPSSRTNFIYLSILLQLKVQPDTAAVEIWSQNKLKINDLLAEQKWIQGLEKQKLKKELDKITFFKS